MIDRAIDLAKTSLYPKYQVGCIICNKQGKIISAGVNQRKSHPYQAEMAKRHGDEKKIWLHAEIAAIIKCRQQPHTVYVARVGKKNITRLAKPCPICFAAIQEAGCKRIVYTDNNYHFSVIDL
jgi:deoxycytidylate deaminase